MKSFKIYCHIVVRIFIDLQDCTYFDLLLSVVRTYILSDVRESNCHAYISICVTYVYCRAARRGHLLILTKKII